VISADNQEKRATKDNMRKTQNINSRLRRYRLARIAVLIYPGKER
jgi:hypothetical protein